jgi:hypothetical protein
MAASVGASSSSSSSSSCDDFVCNLYDLLPSTFTGCFGDVDGNGIVNSGDRGQIQANQGRTDALSLCLYDLDGNGVINAGDRGYVAANFGRCRELTENQGRACDGNQPLSVTWDSGDNLSVAFDQSFTLTANVSDPDGVSPSLSYRWNLEHENGTVVDLPNQSVNDEALTFTFQTGVHDAGLYRATLCILDRCETVTTEATITLVAASDGGGGDGGGTGGGDPGDDVVDPADLETACADLAAAFAAAAGASPVDYGAVAEGTTFNLAASDFVANAPAGTTFTWLVRRCVDAAGAPVACDSDASSASLAPNCSYLGGENDLNSTGQSYSALPATNDRGATAELTVDRTGPQDIVLLASRPGCAEQSAAVASVNAYVQGPLAAGIKVYRLTGSGREGCQGRWEEVNPATTTFEVGERVKFSASPSRGSIVGWSWQFMDSTGGGGEEVIKAYTAPGDFNVQLTVYRANWQSARANVMVQVHNAVEPSLAYTTVDTWSGNPFGPISSVILDDQVWVLSALEELGKMEATTNGSVAVRVHQTSDSLAYASSLASASGNLLVARMQFGVDVYTPDAADGQGHPTLSRIASLSIAEIRQQVRVLLSLPSEPAIVSVIAMAGFGDTMHIVTADEQYLLTYVVAESGSLALTSAEPAPGVSVNSLKVAGDCALVGLKRSTRELVLYDLADPEMPVLAQTLPIDESYVDSLIVGSSRVGVRGYGRLLVYDVACGSAPTNGAPTLMFSTAIDSWTTAATFGADWVIYIDNYQLHKQSIADPTAPYLMTSLPSVSGLGNMLLHFPDGLGGNFSGSLLFAGLQRNGFGFYEAGGQ